MTLKCVLAITNQVFLAKNFGGRWTKIVEIRKLLYQDKKLKSKQNKKKQITGPKNILC